jgi:regulator of nonsense transcripts 1
MLTLLQIEQQAVYIPSDNRVSGESNGYSCYVSLDGVSLNGILDAQAVSHLQIPAGDNLSFTIRFTWYRYQYSTIRISIFARGVMGPTGEEVGVLMMKGVSITSFKYSSYTGRDSISQQLKTWCETIGEAANFPGEIFKLEVQCIKISVSIQDQLYKFVQRRNPAIAERLKNIRDTIATSVDKRIALVFHATADDISSIKDQCDTMENALARDQDKTSAEYPFAPFFHASPVAQQLHIANAPVPTEEEFPTDFPDVLPPVETYDTSEERLVPLVMGAICDHYIEEENSQKLQAADFVARAVELKHYNGECFLLLVESPAEDDVSQPTEGDTCLISLKGVKRVLAPDSQGAEMDRDGYLRDQCQKYVKPERVVPELVKELHRTYNEDPDDLKLRVEALVGSLASSDGLLEESRPSTSEAGWWQAERVSTSVIGSPDGHSTYLVTIPLVPKEEAPKDGHRPLIDVSFPMLKFNEMTSDDKGLVMRSVEEHFSDEKTKIPISIRRVVSDKSLRAGVSAINELHYPESADAEFPVSHWSQETFKWLRDFEHGEQSSLYDTYPQLKTVFETPDQAPAFLTSMFTDLDDDQKAVVHSLDKLVQKTKLVVGVAGSGKTRLLLFIIMGIMFGDKGKRFPVKAMYFVNHNNAVNDFAMELNDLCATEMGIKNAVVRLHGFDTELADWINTTRLAKDKRAELFEAKDAAACLLGVEAQFMVQHQLAQLAIDTHKARAKRTGKRLPVLGLHQVAFQYYVEHKDEYPDLRDALEAHDEGTTDEETTEKRSQLQQLVGKLYGDFIEQFTGVFCATPYAGCRSKFVRHFKADVCFVDEAAKVTEMETFMIIRKHSPAFLLMIGDPMQPGPYVHMSRRDAQVTNPWEMTMKKSTLARALNIGGIIDARLTLNHRGKGGLSVIPSRIIYHNTMTMDEDVWPPEAKKWHQYLRQRCTTLNSGLRVMVELQGAVSEKIGTSSINRKHIEYGCDAVADVMANDELTGVDGKEKTVLVITFYKAQAHLYQLAFDKMVQDAVITRGQRERIDIRTVAAAQGCTAAFVLLDFVRNTCPGFTSEKHALCVALTRARLGEMILMSRGVFVGYKQPTDAPDGHDVRQLANLYSDLGEVGGILTMDVRGPQSEDTSDYECSNCGGKGHRPKECPDTLTCRNCDQSSHTLDTCPQPRVQKCNICQSTEHVKKDCPCCELCRQEGHKRDECTTAMTCHGCNQPGHQIKECPERVAKCRDCGKEGHFAKDCDFCPTCKTTGHNSRRCPTKKKCRVCDEIGHTAGNCPRAECRKCHALGHNEMQCPERLIREGVTFDVSRAKKVNFLKKHRR